MLSPLKAPLVAAVVLAGGIGVALAGPAAPSVDDGALRYFASQGQKVRVEAEAHRLAQKHPGWRMPDDLYAAKPGRSDEGPLWVLFTQNRLDALQTAVAAREADEPGWHPSPDLLEKIKQKTLRATIVRLNAEGDWRGVVQSAKASGTAWAQKDAEALWFIAEAFARGNDCAEAYVTYRLLLDNHSDPAERLATIQRAIATVPMDYVEKLLAMGQRGEDGRGEFDAIALDVTRARIAAFLHDEKANPVSAGELAAFETYAKSTNEADQLGLVAWYAFKRGDHREALDWFKQSIAHGGDAMIAHGLAHTLRKLGMKREAEEVAYAWREPLVNNAILFIDLLEEDLTQDRPPYIEPARVTRYAKVAVDTGSGEGAQALAWYAYNTCQYPLALEWFQRAVAWLPKEATAYGYALTLQRLKRAKDFREVVNRYDGLFPRVVALAFDDGRTRSPAPCEASLGTPSAPPRQPDAHGFEAHGSQAPGSEASLDWNGRSLADTLAPPRVAIARAPAAALLAQYARARVPSPASSEALAGRERQPLTKKTDFPFSVGAENPLRFSPLRTVAAEDGAHGSVQASLVARRVPGVGAMPYEAYGFALKPGWNGATEPTSPTAAERPAPAGTLAAGPVDGRPRDAVSAPAPVPERQASTVSPAGPRS